VTTPVELTEATKPELLVHVPPDGVPVSDMVVPAHIELPVPLMVAPVLTVTVRVAGQPEGVAYVMVAVPALTPDTTPALLTVATAVLLLLHVPPDGPPLSVVVEPMHKVAVPESDTVVVVTVTVWVAVQPPDEKEIVTVPVPMPVTTPELLTVASDGLLVLHVPPDVAESVMVEPVQTELLPVIAAAAVIVMVRVAEQPPSV